MTRNFWRVRLGAAKKGHDRYEEYIIYARMKTHFAFLMDGVKLILVRISTILLMTMNPYMKSHLEEKDLLKSRDGLIWKKGIM